MRVLIIIILVAVFYYLVIKPRKNNASTTSYQNHAAVQQSQTVDQPTPGINHCPADALINSPYYSKYKTVFDLIWHDGKQPKYKIDWLLQSLNMGRELEDSGTYVLASIKNGLPYFCETEYEFDKFFDYDKPVTLGSIDGLMDICFFYHETNRDHSHPEKRQYWQQQLRELALSGNLEAQGALCSNFAKFVFSESEVAEFKEKYESSLFSLAESGDAYAQLAVGEFLSPYRSQESLGWLIKAANQGLSNAWFQLGKAYNAMISLDDNGHIRKVPLPEEEKHSLERKIAESYYKGAEANNGVMAARCQHIVGMYYEDGNSIFPKDIEKAKYWYQKSLENSDANAKY
ncbi:MAG: hypothetical protein Q4C50_01300 [Eubacteriales bacterium]|nr:hypothetical protein [Eubacteriales bacterium]